MKAAFVLLFLCGFHNLLACSCTSIPKLTKPSITKAKNIFVGTVSRIEHTTHHSIKVTFQLVESLKTDGSTAIAIFTPEGSSDCGLNLKEGQQWYIFTEEREENSWAGLCGRSALLSEHSIPLNSYKKSFYRSAVSAYEKARRRARREILFIKKNYK